MITGVHAMFYSSFYCDDIKKTVAELKRRGVEFTGEVQDHGYGLVTHFRVPGDFEVQLYQPRYLKRPKARRSASASPRRTKRANPKRPRHSR